MPQHESAWKRMRTSTRERSYNRAVRSQVRKALKTYREAPVETKGELLAGTTSLIDNAVRKGVIKDTTANRIKSRLARQLNRERTATA